MKKHVVTLFVLSIMIVSLYAQKPYVGIKGGVNLADVSNMNGESRLSGHIGLLVHGRMSKNWSIQPEILYSGQGQRYKIVNDNYTLALSYIQVPVMFQYHPDRQFYLEFGPQLGFLLTANVKNDGNKSEVDDDYNKLDLGLAFGIGVQATRTLGIFARYNVGLVDITDEDRRDLYNRVGQIGISIRLQ